MSYQQRHHMRGLSTLEVLFCVLLLIIVADILLPVFGHPRRSAGGSCSSSQRQIALATQIYAQENNDHLPGTSGQPASWRDHGKTSIDMDDKVLVCYSAKIHTICNYGFNAELLGVVTNSIQMPMATILTADSDPGLTLREISDIACRHAGGTICSFVDGHVEYIKSPKDKLASGKYLLHVTTGVIDEGHTAPSRSVRSNL